MKHPLRFFGAEDEQVTTTSTTADDTNVSYSGDETPVRQVTADELEAIAAKASNRASRAANKQLAEELGFESIGAMKEWVATYREEQNKQKSEAERQLEEAIRVKTEAESMKSQLRTERLDVAVRRALVNSNISSKRLEKAVILVNSELSQDDLEDDENWTNAITAAVTAVKNDMPELWGTKSFGSGDGGTQGGSTKDAEAEQTERIMQGLARRGYTVVRQP